MGTSSPNGGSSGKNPLIPTWLVDPIDSGSVDGENSNEKPTDGTNTDEHIPVQPYLTNPLRYSAARGNFTRFVKSGGHDNQSLRRAVSGYVRHSSGGSKNATAKMGSSRKTASKLVGFLQEASNNGIASALRSLNLESLASKPFDELFLEISDFISPEGGTVDAGIARDALIKTIATLGEEQILSDEKLSAEQVQTIVEMYITNTIENKLLNEIGNNTFFQTQTLEDAEFVENQLHDFIKNNVSDSFANTQSKIGEIPQTEIINFVDQIYENTFELLSSLYQKSSPK